jgi:hypothetical protein
LQVNASHKSLSLTDNLAAGFELLSFPQGLVDVVDKVPGVELGK